MIHRFREALEIAKNAKAGEIVFRRIGWPPGKMLKKSAGPRRNLIILKTTDGENWDLWDMPADDRDASDWQVAKADELKPPAVRTMKFHEMKQRLVADPKLSARRECWKGTILQWHPGIWIAGAGMTAGRFHTIDELGNMGIFITHDGTNAKHLDAEDWIIVPPAGQELAEDSKAELASRGEMPLVQNLGVSPALWTDIVDRITGHVCARRRDWPGQQHVYRGERNGEPCLFWVEHCNGTPRPYSTSGDDNVATDWVLIRFDDVRKLPLQPNKLPEMIATDEPVDDEGRQVAEKEFWGLLESSGLTAEQLEAIADLLNLMGYTPVETREEAFAREFEARFSIPLEEARELMMPVRIPDSFLGDANRAARIHMNAMRLFGKWCADRVYLDHEHEAVGEKARRAIEAARVFDAQFLELMTPKTE